MSDKDVVVGIGTDLDASGLDELLKKLTDVETFSSRVGGGFKQIDSAIADSFHASDLALQRYRERLETLSSQGAAPSPAQLQSLMQARLRAQEALGAVAPVAMETPEMMFGGRVAAGMGGAPGKMLFGKPGHEQMIEMGSPEYAALRSVLEHEVQVREEALAGLEDFHKKEKDVRSRDEQEGGGGGGRRGSFARDAGSTALGLLAGLGVPLTIFGILEALGIPKMFMAGPGLFEQREKYGAMMGGLGLGTSGIESGYGYGYLQGESMPAAEAWGRGSGGMAGFRSMMRYSRAYSQDPNAMGQFADMAFVSGPGETTQLLRMIAAHTKDMTGGFAKLGDVLRDYMGVGQLGLATQYAPDPSQWGAVMNALGEAMGPQYTGRVGGMFQRMQGAVTNPGEAQSAFWFRALGGTRGVPYSQVMYQQAHGLFGGEASDTDWLTRTGQILPGANLSGGAFLNAGVSQLMREIPDSFLQRQGMKTLFNVTEDEAVKIQREIGEHGKISVDTLADISERLKGAQTEEERRAKENITALHLLGVHQEQTSYKLAASYMPLLTDLRNMTADFVGIAAPYFVTLSRPIVQAISNRMEGGVRIPEDIGERMSSVRRIWGANNNYKGQKPWETLPEFQQWLDAVDDPAQDMLRTIAPSLARGGRASSPEEFVRAFPHGDAAWMAMNQDNPASRAFLTELISSISFNTGGKDMLRAFDRHAEGIEGIGENTKRMADLQLKLLEERNRVLGDSLNSVP